MNLLRALPSVVFLRHNKFQALSSSVPQILSGFLLFVWGFLHPLAKLSRIPASKGREKKKKELAEAFAGHDMDAPRSLPPGSWDVSMGVLKVCARESISGGITMKQFLRMDSQGIIRAIF